MVALTKIKPCDSIMCLPEDWKMHPATIVFEPNAKHLRNLGGFSTMCGNGIRAVAEFISKETGKSEIKIATLSGNLNVVRVGENWQTKMGKLYDGLDYVKQYVKNYPLLSEPDFSLLGFGITSTAKDVIDGEPHLVLRCQDNLSLEQLYHLAYMNGQRITKDLRSFPSEINCNFVSLQKNGTLNLVTHERNLGDNPQKSITQACGTGSTVTAGILMQLQNIEKIIINCLGGSLEVDQPDENLYLTGPVMPL